MCSLIHRAVLAAGEEEKRRIEVHVPEQLPLVWAGAEAVLEVLANFLSNARALSPYGGAITVVARQVAYTVEMYISETGPPVLRPRRCLISSVTSTARTDGSGGWASVRALDWR